MDSGIVSVLVLCLIQASFGQRTAFRSLDTRFDPRWTRSQTGQGSFSRFVDRGRWTDPFDSFRGGVSREERQLSRLLDLGLPSRSGHVSSSQSRHRESGTRTRTRGGSSSQIVIEIGGRGQTASNRMRSRNRDFGRESNRFERIPRQRDSMFMSSRSPTADRSFHRESSFGQFNDVGAQQTSQPVIIRAGDQVIPRSDIISSSRPAHDTLRNPDPLPSSAIQTNPSSGGWQEMNVPNMAVDPLLTSASSVQSNNKSPSIIRNPATSGSGQSVSGTRTSDILIQTSPLVSQGASTTQVVSTNTAGQGANTLTSNVSNNNSGSLQNMLMSLIGERNTGFRGVPPTEEPLDLDELLIRKLLNSPNLRTG